MDDSVKKTPCEPACFTGDTLVLTKVGHVEIREVEPGLEVLSRCEETGEMGWRKVLERFKRGAPILYLSYSNEQGTQTFPLRTTAEHPFWIRGRGWTEVRDLKRGDIMETCDGAKYAGATKWSFKEQTQIYPGATVTVVSIDDPGQMDEVYNLSVEGFHTYFVGMEGLLVRSDKTQPGRACKG